MKIKQQSVALGDRIYSSNWMDMKSNYKKTLLQMMHRCQKPFTINAGIFGPLTMEMYSKASSKTTLFPSNKKHFFTRVSDYYTERSLFQSMQMTYSMWTVFKGRAAHWSEAIFCVAFSHSARKPRFWVECINWFFPAFLTFRSAGALDRGQVHRGRLRSYANEMSIVD